MSLSILPFQLHSACLWFLCCGPACSSHRLQSCFRYSPSGLPVRQLLTPQRLRDAIDSRIAEEQARQKSAQDSISRSNSARRPPGRSLSPGARPRPRRNTSGTPVRGPDPTEFEAEFAIGDDEDSSRSDTPRLNVTPPSENQNTENATEEKHPEPSEKEAASEPQLNQLPSELPPEIRAKLRRLDKMESRYRGMC